MKRLFWCALVVMTIGYFIYGLNPDPRITLANLNGLTPTQVVARLGTPEYSALPTEMIYTTPLRWRQFAYTVWFESGKVVRVDINEK